MLILVDTTVHVVDEVGVLVVFVDLLNYRPSAVDVYAVQYTIQYNAVDAVVLSSYICCRCMYLTPKAAAASCTIDLKNVFFCTSPPLRWMLFELFMYYF